MKILYPNRVLSILSVLFVSTFFLISCSKSKDDVTAGTTQNKPPQSFTVSLSHVSITEATINWSVANDPEGGEVLYSIELNNQLVASNLKTASHTLTNLIKNTLYTGKVTAADPAGNKTTTTFTFTTSDVPPDFAIKIDSTSNKSVLLSWESTSLPSGTASYTVYQNNVLVAGNVSESKFTFNKLQPQTSYQFKIVAKTNAGREVEKIIDVATRDNKVPQPISITEQKHGFSFAILSCNGTTDADKDSLRWFAVINNSEVALPSLNDRTAAFNYLFKELAPDQNHTISLKVKDEFGAEVTSNAISIKTYKAPGTPVISAKQESDKVVVEWITHTFDEADAAQSYFYINGELKDNMNSKISYTKQVDNTVLVKLTLDQSYFEENIEKAIKISLHWGANNNNLSTISNTIKFTRSTYTPSSAIASNVVIKGPGTYSPQFFINFKNCVISDYAIWEVKEIRFDNIVSETFVGFAICDVWKTGYYTGNLTVDQYNYLKTKNTGHIIIKDAGGLHKITFTYTTED